MPSCIDKEGNLDTLADCQCNEAICNTGQYCASKISQCVDEPIVTCTDNIRNENTCKCASNFCVTDQVCNSGACGYETCSSGETPIKCSCGDTLCERGKHCYATINMCTDDEIDNCANTDGTAPSPTNCVCGTDVCSEENGRYCNGDTCEKHHVDAVRVYKLVTSGFCRYIGWEEPDKSQCTKAAIQPSLSFDIARYWDKSSCSGSDYNTGCGCFIYAGSNDLMSYPGTRHYECSATKRCICTLMTNPCNYQNGQNNNIGPHCQCNTTLCEADTGMYCTASESKCTINPPCSETSLNTQVCTCGNVQCAENTRCKRESDVGYCSCENQNGLASNDKDCLCGDTFCTSGLYCNAAASKCGTDGVFEFKSLLTSGTAYDCTNTRGFEIISSAAECAEITGMEVVEVDIYDADISARCSINGSVAIYNSEDASPGPCTDEKPCVCLSTGSMCKYTEGKFINQEDTCFCGADYCTIETGMMCNNGVCSDVTSCSNIDGILPNNRDCTCGDTFCSLEPESIKKTVILYQEVGTIPTCSNTDGSVPIKEGLCKCGSVACTGTKTTQMYCDASKNQCNNVPYCTNTDGTTANPVACKCGNDVCTEATDMHCYASQNRCRPGPVCASTDGTSANPSTCACGSVDCETAETTGMFCMVALNTCSKDGLFTLFEERQAGKCTDKTGGTRPASITQCEAAATALGWPDTTVSELNHDNVPPGCYLSNQFNSLRFNTYTSSIRPCSHSSKCICVITALACMNTDGVTINSGGSCICGNKACDGQGTGMICDTESSTCSRPAACTNANGMIPNMVDCACGNNDCTATTGLFCDAYKNQCDNVPYCGAVRGTTANPSTCACGSTICESAGTTGMYCYRLENKCRKFANAVTMFEARSSGKCTDEPEGAWIETKSKCEEGIRALGWVDPSGFQYADDNYPAPHWPRGCYRTSNGYLYFNTNDFQDINCGYDSKTCICIVVRPG